MKFQFQNSLINESQIKTSAQNLVPYIQHLKEVVSSANYEAAESSINLSTDAALLGQVMAMKDKKVSPELKYIIDIGIGGSNLGTKAIYDAFYGHYDMLQPDRFPKMIFLDTTDEVALTHCVALISTLKTKQEILVNAISKSGGTTETIVNLELVMKALTTRFPEVMDRFVITTDDGSKMHQSAQQMGIDTLTLPKQVGGRYSVFSPVGLFPLSVCGFDINSLLTGAKTMREQCLAEDPLNNPALVSAIILFSLSTQGKNINDNFIYAPQLESLGKWYRQLMGESIGKEHDLNSNVVRAGITPTVSIGSTDLHSVAQLYLGGPKDKITTFISSEKSQSDLPVPSALQFPLVEGIAGKPVSSIMLAILEAVKIAYSKQQLPFMHVSLETVDEKSLGEFMQFKMIEMMYLGKLMNVNAFDQPHVELYKVELKKILGQ